MRADNSLHLVQAARARAESVRARAVAALRDLVAAGAEVTPTTVAMRAGVSRQWIYAYPEILDAVKSAGTDNHRRRAAPTRHRASEASLQRRVESLTDANQRLKATVADLEARLALAYGELRAQAVTPGRP